MFFPTAEFRNQDRAEYVKKQKHRQELQRQQEAMAAETLKAAEKPPDLQAAEAFSQARENFSRIQLGDPYAMEQMRKVIGGLFDVLEYLLGEQNQQKGGE